MSEMFCTGKPTIWTLDSHKKGIIVILVSEIDIVLGFLLVFLSGRCESTRVGLVHECSGER